MSDDLTYIGGNIVIRPAVTAEWLYASNFHEHAAIEPVRVLFLPDPHDEDEATEIAVVGADQTTCYPDVLVDDLAELVEALGATHTFTGQFDCEGPGHEFYRVRVVNGQVVTENAQLVYPSDYAIPAGPAVTFDPTAARAWLTESTGGWVRACDYNIDPADMYEPTFDESPADWLERLLCALDCSSPAAPHVWRTAPGVSIEVIETVGEGGRRDGGAVLVVEVGGLRVASRWLEDTELATYDTDDASQANVPQIEVAIQALTRAADEVNRLVERHRLVRATDLATTATDTNGGGRTT